MITKFGQDAIRKLIEESESTLDKGRLLPRELSAAQSELQDKASRIEKIRDEIKDTKYDIRIQDISNRMKELEEQREVLNTDLKNLSLQADARAKLDIKRTDLKKKTQNLEDIIELNNSQFRKLVGLDIRLDTVETDIERVIK